MGVGTQHPLGAMKTSVPVRAYSFYVLWQKHVVSSASALPSSSGRQWTAVTNACIVFRERQLVVVLVTSWPNTCINMNKYFAAHNLFSLTLSVPGSTISSHSYRDTDYETQNDLRSPMDCYSLFKNKCCSSIDNHCHVLAGSAYWGLNRKYIRTGHISGAFGLRSIYLDNSIIIPQHL